MNTCFPASKTLATTEEREEGGSWSRHLEKLLRAGGSFVILERAGKTAMLFY